MQSWEAKCRAGIARTIGDLDSLKQCTHIMTIAVTSKMKCLIQRQRQREEKTKEIRRQMEVMLLSCSLRVTHVGCSLRGSGSNVLTPALASTVVMAEKAGMSWWLHVGLGGDQEETKKQKGKRKQHLDFSLCGEHRDDSS